MIDGGGSGDGASGRILDQLKFIEGLEREIREKGVTAMNAGCNQDVNENGGAGRCEGWAEATDVTKMETYRPTDTLTLK